MKFVKLLLVCTMVPLLCTGCLGTIFREGKGTLGASGIDVELRKAPNLESYQNFETGKFTDGMLGKTPMQLLRLLPGEITSQMRQYDIPVNPRGKTILISGEVIHYDVATGAIAAVFGPLEEAVVRVTLTDKDTGKVLGIANCVGRSKANTNKGLDEKARGVGKAIIKWIGKHRKVTKLKED